jgi:hypothetical protein
MSDPETQKQKENKNNGYIIAKSGTMVDDCILREHQLW